MTTPPEGPGATAVPALEDDFRYQRIGYVDQKRKSDLLLSVFLTAIPGDGELPRRWHWRTHKAFMRRHGALGALLWARANNSHLLMVNGFHAVRIWHDTAQTCFVDLADNVCGNLPPNLAATVVAVPTSNWRKSKPFTKRVCVWQQWQMQDIADAVKRTYGLGI